MKKALQDIMNKHFDFLITELDYSVEFAEYDENTFGNYVIILRRQKDKIKITSDRSQIFVEIFDMKTGWIDKESILQNNGIPFERHKIINGLWEGFLIEKVSMDLKKYKLQLKISKKTAANKRYI